GRGDVLAREVWIRIEEIGFRGTLTELSQNQLNRNPRTADHRLTQHHVRVHVDSVGEGHSILSAADATSLESLRKQQHQFLHQHRCSELKTTMGLPISLQILPRVIQPDLTLLQEPVEFVPGFEPEDTLERS